MNGEVRGRTAGGRVSDGFAKLLAAIAGMVAFTLTGTILAATNLFGGALGNASFVWAPLSVAAIAWFSAHQRMTRLVYCQSGCGKRHDVLARRCPRCGRPR